MSKYQEERIAIQYPSIASLIVIETPTPHPRDLVCPLVGPWTPGGLVGPTEVLRSTRGSCSPPLIMTGKNVFVMNGRQMLSITAFIAVSTLPSTSVIQSIRDLQGVHYLDGLLQLNYLYVPNQIRWACRCLIKCFLLGVRY